MTYDRVDTAFMDLQCKPFKVLLTLFTSLLNFLNTQGLTKYGFSVFGC